MRNRRSASKFAVAQDERQRHAGRRKQHQRPEHIDICQIGCLRLNLLRHPGKGLLLRLYQRTALLDKVLRHLLQGELVLRTGRDDVLDQPALMKLLAMRQDIRRQRHADRAASIARHVHQGGRLIGLVGWKAVIGRRDDGKEDRSEEHTSELQSLRHLVCRLLLEKKKNKNSSCMSKVVY